MHQIWHSINGISLVCTPLFHVFTILIWLKHDIKVHTHCFIIPEDTLENHSTFSSLTKRLHYRTVSDNQHKRCFRVLCSHTYIR